ncbi:head-tail connector protein [Phreatobacter sp.]|uniref:head-tail connector protein n=1 Tax=Phreatobacter sp. TaxID=1966341 RepID=UPI003F726692
MSLYRIEPPAAEPVTPADLKAFLKLDGAEEDALIASVAMAARAHLEALTQKVFITQRWRITRDSWPASGRIALPIGPVTSLDRVTVDAGEGPEDLALTGLTLDGLGQPPRLAFRPRSLPVPAVPLGGIAIEVTAGFGGPDDVPAPLVQAVRLLAAHWFENRTLVGIGHEVSVTPRGIEALIAPFQVRRVA